MPLKPGLKHLTPPIFLGPAAEEKSLEAGVLRTRRVSDERRLWTQGSVTAKQSGRFVS